MSFSEWQIFKSTSIAAGRYDAITHTLEIQFNEGKIYRYVDVPLDIWLSLCRADSKGSYFQFQIRDKFRHEIKGEAESASQTEDNYPTRRKKNISGDSLSNPFHTSSIPYAYKLLDGLSYKTESGYFKIRYERLGSQKVDGLPEPVDCYELFIDKKESYQHSEKIIDFYIYSYSNNPDKIESLPKGLIFNGNQSDVISNNPKEDSAKSYYDLALKVVEEGKTHRDVAKSITLLRKSAELNYQPAQELLFIVLAKRGDGSRATVKEAEKWYYRSERSKLGLPNSVKTDFSLHPNGPQGCLGVIVITILTLSTFWLI